MLLRERPTFVTALGVTHILIGCFLGVCHFCNGGIFLLGSADADQQITIFDFMSRAVPGYAAIATTFLLIGFAQAIVYFIAGLGLLQGYPWARKVAIFNAYVAILSFASQFIYEIAFDAPALKTFVEQNVLIFSNWMRNLVTIKSSIVGAVALAFLAYSVLVLRLLKRPAALDFFFDQGEALRSTLDQIAGTDDDWLHRRRRRRP